MSPTQPLPIFPLNTLAEDPALVQALAEACDQHGFFCVREHGISPTLIQRAIDASWRFFMLPIEVKARYGHEAQHVRPRTSRGYIPALGEMLHRDDGPDVKETFDLGVDRPLSGQPFTGPNLLPDDDVAPDFAAAQLDLQEAVLGGVVPRLLHALARTLNLAPTFFDPRFSDPVLIQRALYYSPHHSGAGRHTDTGIFTVLIQEPTPTPCLQVWAQGAWFDVPSVEGTLVINLGDMLQHWTGGRLVSTPHRVRNRNARGRVSLAFFVFPNIDTVFQPIGRTDATPLRSQEVMLRNFQSIWVEGQGSGRAQELE